jgi:hypothetical protein
MNAEFEEMQRDWFAWFFEQHGERHPFDPLAERQCQCASHKCELNAERDSDFCGDCGGENPAYCEAASNVVPFVRREA